MTSALLVIDMQNGIVEEGYRADAVLATVRDLCHRARAADMPVIYLRHAHGEDGFLQHGTPAWEIHRAVAPHERDVVLDKRANDAFHETPLGDELRRRGVKRVIITGMATEQCVDTTARSALSHDLDVTVVADGHTTVEYPGVLPATERIAYHNLVLPFIATATHTITVVPGAEIRFAGG